MARPRFPMHDYHMHKSLKQIGLGIIFSGVSTIAFYAIYVFPRRAKYTNFYSNYDPMASFNRMRAGGYLSSCPPLEKK